MGACDGSVDRPINGRYDGYGAKMGSHTGAGVFCAGSGWPPTDSRLSVSTRRLTAP